MIKQEDVERLPSKRWPRFRLMLFWLEQSLPRRADKLWNGAVVLNRDSCGSRFDQGTAHGLDAAERRLTDGVESRKTHG